MKFLFLTLLSFFTLGHKNICHPVHFSVVNMEYNNKTQEFDISFKLFFDDFEKIINHNYNVVLNLGKENQLPDCNKYIDRYIKKNFIILFDKKNAGKKMQQERFEIKQDEKSIWIYYHLKFKKPRKVIIRNTLMNDLYSDQKNLFIFTIDKFQEAKKFKKSDTDLQFVVK